jgi:hypothetical protein
MTSNDLQRNAERAFRLAQWATSETLREELLALASEFFIESRFSGSAGRKTPRERVSLLLVYDRDRDSDGAGSPPEPDEKADRTPSPEDRDSHAAVRSSAHEIAEAPSVPEEAPSVPEGGR